MAAHEPPADVDEAPWDLSPGECDEEAMWRRVESLGRDIAPFTGEFWKGEPLVVLPLRELVRLLDALPGGAPPRDAMRVPVIPPDASLYHDDEPWQFDAADEPAVITGYSEATRDRAARHVDDLYARFHKLWHELELIVLGLEAPAERYACARTAQQWLRHALLGVEYPLIRGLDEAGLCLRTGEPHWKPRRLRREAARLAGNVRVDFLLFRNRWARRVRQRFSLAERDGLRQRMRQLLPQRRTDHRRTGSE